MTTQVMTKASKNRPSIPTRYFVDITKNSIAIFVQKNGTLIPGASFTVGDTAEYGSYNLQYLGKITKITDKCVTIVAYEGSTIEKTHRLCINEFCWRNHDFDLATVTVKNHETMMYI
jgi:hypothetical protein